jgi:hypothetical protein
MHTCVKRGKKVGASQHYQEFTSRKKISSHHKEAFISLLYCGGVTLPLCGTVVANRPIARSMKNWWINTERWWDDNWHRNTKVLREHNIPSITPIDHKPRPITWWSNSCLHGLKPATKPPWYTTASEQYYKVTEGKICVCGFWWQHTEGAKKCVYILRKEKTVLKL